jgi:hypothetical protein
MLSAISGVVIAGAGSFGLWYLRPHNGIVNPLAIKPVLDFAIPISIISAIALGVGLIFVGFAEY